MRTQLPSLLLIFVALTGSTATLVGQDFSKPDGAIRVATFNCSLNRDKPGQLANDLKSGDNEQARKIAEIIQRVKPDLLLLNEFDYDSSGDCLKTFSELYLQKSQNQQTPVEFAHSFSASVNTGVDSGFDLNRDGKSVTPDDALGFGRHPGQYGMAVFSKFPIDREQVRTFQKFLWADMPSGLWPVDPKTNGPYYNDEIKKVFRLSSKSHWDIPIIVDDRTVHFLVCHPTPPVFDGPEDRNGARNHDEIRLWADYVGGKSNYLYDDNGRKGGLKPSDLFVIAGDMNADPNDGDSRDKPSLLLLNHPRIADPKPTSVGGKEQAVLQGGLNSKHTGDPALDTGDFFDRTVGNLRIDYVLPCKELTVLGSGVYWPANSQPEFGLVDCSDHRLVWVDVK